MARRKVGKKNVVKVDFAGYSYLLNGVAGIGKTTLAYEVGRKLYGEDGVLLLTIGQEPEPSHLGGVLKDKAKDWKELKEIVADLTKYRNEDYSDLKLIAIDTVDEVFRLAEDYIIQEYNKQLLLEQNPNSKKKSNPAKSIGQCYGGFQKGENRVVDEVINTLFSLRDYGYGLFFIGHTKQKNKKDAMTDIEFELITSSLDSKYYNAIKDKVNIVACGYIERELDDVEEVDDAFSKSKKQVGRLVSEKRVITFRDEEYAIDVKSHFEYIEPKIEFDSNIFIDTVIDAIKKQYGKYHGEVDDKKIEALKEEQVAERDSLAGNNNKQIEDNEINIARNIEIKDLIVSKWKDASAETKEEAKKIMANHNILKIGDIENNPTKGMEEILQLIG